MQTRTVQREFPATSAWEFLGDSVLGFGTAKHLYNTVPTLPEGKMTRLRAELVCEHSLYGVAQELELGAYLRMGHGEEKTEGASARPYLPMPPKGCDSGHFPDGGIEPAASFIERMVLSPEAVKAHHASDYKKPSFGSLFSASPTGF